VEELLQFKKQAVEREKKLTGTIEVLMSTISQISRV
jgi:hypothetical protein